MHVLVDYLVESHIFSGVVSRLEEGSFTKFCFRIPKSHKMVNEGLLHADRVFSQI